MSSFKKLLCLAPVLVWIIMHLPFVIADPDITADPLTRGAFTDEGLYSSQICNYVDHGNFDLHENSTMVRGPLLGILLLPFYFLFGTHLWVGRLIAIVFTAFTLFVYLRNKQTRILGMFLFVISLLQYHIYQFSHYALAESFCMNFILLSVYVYFFASSLERSRKQRLMLLLSVTLIFMAYACKIQYLYMIVVLPAVSLFEFVSASLRNRKNDREKFSKTTLVIMFSFFLLALYYFAWYLPNREFYLYVMNSESSGRYPQGLSAMWDMVVFNYDNLIWLPPFKVFLWQLYIALPLLVIYRIFTKNKSSIYSVFLVFSVVWLITELHKIPMTYLPNRYLLPALMAAGLLMSVFLVMLAEKFAKYRWVVFLIIGLILLFNLYDNSKALHNRKYQLKEVNDYLASYQLKNSVMIGPWAASCNWESNAKTLPVWNNYFNWKDPVNKYKPAIIISEFNEVDSDSAYSRQGIKLSEISDSSRTFDVWTTKLVVYWMRK